MTFELTSKTLDTGLTYRFNINLEKDDPVNEAINTVNMSLKDCDNLPEFDIAHDLMGVIFD